MWRRPALGSLHTAQACDCVSRFRGVFAHSYKRCRPRLFLRALMDVEAARAGLHYRAFTVRRHKRDRLRVFAAPKLLVLSRNDMLCCQHRQLDDRSCKDRGQLGLSVTFDRLHHDSNRWILFSRRERQPRPDWRHCTDLLRHITNFTERLNSYATCHYGRQRLYGIRFDVSTPRKIRRSRQLRSDPAS